MNKTNNPQELTIEEMIVLGYSEDAIHKALERKLQESKVAQQNKKIVEAREKAIAALTEYMITLGVPASEIRAEDLAESFSSFEKNVAPALKVFAKLPKKNEAKSTLDEMSLESALESLRRFADSL